MPRPLSGFGRAIRPGKRGSSAAIKNGGGYSNAVLAAAARGLRDVDIKRFYASSRELLANDADVGFCCFERLFLSQCGRKAFRRLLKPQMFHINAGLFTENYPQSRCTAAVRARSRPIVMFHDLDARVR